MDTKATAILHDGSKVSGRLTTDHSASSYGQPVFVDEENQAYNWAEIADVEIDHAAALGSIKSAKKTIAARENAKKGGWPKGKPRKPKPD